MPFPIAQGRRVEPAKLPEHPLFSKKPVKCAPHGVGPQIQINLDDVDELFGGLGAAVGGIRLWIHHVFADVIFDHFRDEAIERAATRGRLLQYRGALLFRVQRPFDGLQLTAHSLNSI